MHWKSDREKRGVVTNPKHTTIWAAMKMINSLPVRFSTQTKDTQFTKNKQTKTKKKKISLLHYDHTKPFCKLV